MNERKRSGGLPAVWAFLILAALTMLLNGCAFGGKLKGKAGGIGDGKLVKKLGLVMVRSAPTAPESELLSAYAHELGVKIEKSCDRSYLVKPGDIDYPANIDRLAGKDGDSPGGNLQLAEAARQTGFQTLIVAEFPEITDANAERGILWFKDTHHIYKIFAAVSVYDTETGAKLLDRSLSREVKGAEVEEGDDQPENWTNIPEIEQSVMKMADAAADEICDAIERQRWSASVAAVDPPFVGLAAGRLNGVEPGDTFAVYARGSLIEGAGGEKFRLKGNKIAEVKIIEADPEKSKGKVISGEDVLSGYSIGKAE